MKVHNKLPDTSSVWVYQSNKEFTEEKVKVVQEKLNHFIGSWEAHGTRLHAVAEIFYNRFIVLFVDETPQQATGCSIDKSVAFIKSLEADLGIQLMDRMNLAYQNNNKVVSVSMAEFQTLIKEGKLKESTVVYNNMVQTKQEFISAWEVPAKESWHQNLFMR